MPSDLAERLWKLIQLIGRSGGFGSVTLVLEKGRVARLVWSVDERLIGPGPEPNHLSNHLSK
jgi:hypothetical protein